MDLWPRLVQRRKCPSHGNFCIQLLSRRHQDILRQAHQRPHQQATSETLLSIHFSLYSLFLLPSLSPALCHLSPALVPLPLLSPTLPSTLSTLPNVRRCGKRHVLSFPQCSAGCQCRRWTPSRQLCLCWALWFTVRGHSPRTGNLWKLPFWQPSPQVSF